MAVYRFKGITPTLGKDVWVAPNGTVIGDVVLGDEASVWFGAVVRGDHFPIRIGARTNIQDNAVVHITGGISATTIGDDVTVGHSAIVHGCRVGNHVLVGMGSIILDDAVVEDECIVAAGALVPPRAVIPSRSLVVGRPARVLRQLSDNDLQHIRLAAASYVYNAREFRESLEPT